MPFGVEVALLGRVAVRGLLQEDLSCVVSHASRGVLSDTAEGLECSEGILLDAIHVFAIVAVYGVVD